MSFAPIFVMRHGETVWNAEGRFQGALNSPLTELGRAQARQLGETLARHDLTGFDVRVSPQGRAFETAALALAHQVNYLRTDERLREIEVGAWSGLLRAECEGAGPLHDETPDGPLALYENAPGGEGYAALRARCQSFLQELTGPTLIVTHGITSRMLRSVAMGRPSATLGELSGGQGMIYVVENGTHRRLE
ncbi:MAG: histidine phosphatase family protein [Pseudomonadota bacterium]